MSGIFGIFHRDNKPVTSNEIQRMRDAMAHWGPDGSGMWINGCAALGQCLLYNTPEALFEVQPRWMPEYKLALTAEARVDNRDELHSIFDIPYAERSHILDSDLILQAYVKWGKDSPDHILGDWSFAVWHPAERRLFLARDHHGNTSLYYFINDRYFAFASSRDALLALPDVPNTLNELRIAQLLTSWTGDGVETVFKNIQRLAPSHTMSVMPDKLELQRYWYLENTPLIHRKSNEEYITEFLDIYTQAVQCRLRSLRPIGSTLSGGLDSGSVTALAAKELREQNKVLLAFTAVPLFDVAKTIGRYGIGDEYLYAAATAQYAGNIELSKITSQHISPIDGIKRSLNMHNAPSHAAGNSYWIIDLMQTAKNREIGTLLTGQGGNGSISWPGTKQSHSFWLMLKQRQFIKAIKQKLFKPLIPDLLMHRYKLWKQSGTLRTPDQPFLEYSAIHPEFARKLKLTELMKHAGHDPFFLRDNQLSRQHRYKIIAPGSSIVGCKWAENGAGFDMEIRDPTFDKRLLTYCLSIPDQAFTSSNHMDRLLIREAMTGLLPDKVRLNQIRGRQAADIGHRIIQHSTEMETTLSELSKSRLVQQIIDLNRIWLEYRALHAKVNLETNQNSITIILRGMMVGLFLQHLEA